MSGGAAASIPVTGPAIWRDCRAGVGYCQGMLGIIHLKHSQDRNALPGAGTFVSIASVMACPGQLILAMRSLPNVDT